MSPTPPHLARDYIRFWCDQRQLALADILGPSRWRPLVRHRQALYHDLILHRSDLSIPQIARALRRDHHTIYHGARAHAQREALPDPFALRRALRTAQPR